MTLPPASNRDSFPIMPTLVSVSNAIERSLWTAEDFLDWLQPGIHADLIDGEKFMHSPVNLRHADLLNFLDNLLRLHIEEHDLGLLYRECVAVRLSARNLFLPDLVFLSNEQAAQAGDAVIAFAPTLIVEALSPHTADRDVGPKFAAYEEHGVMEYWVLDPDTQAHRFYARDGEVFVEFASGDEVIRSKHLAGFAMRRCWLGPELPKVRDAFANLSAGI
jgi:Uma2 family endonuclease